MSENIKVICYGQETVWQNRREAIRFYLQAIAASEGSEQERYVNIYYKLIFGMDVCDDGPDFPTEVTEKMEQFMKEVAEHGIC